MKAQLWVDGVLDPVAITRVPAPECQYNRYRRDAPRQRLSLVHRPYR